MNDIINIDIDIEKLFDDILEGIKIIAKEIFPEYAEEAAKDGAELLADSKEKIGEWTVLLAKKKLTEGEFKALIRCQKVLAKMTYLKQMGLLKVRIDRFRRKVFDLIIDTVLDAVF